MRTKKFSGILLLMALGLLLPSGAPAAVVGHITQVEGRVDLLKKGQLPATPVKLQDGVEKGDLIRTKSLSKAQITFVDKSTLSIAPESRIAIEEYMVDEGKGKRNAVLQMFQGLALAVVSKIYQSEEPNFIVKTQTAIMGIRGTEVGIRIYPNYAEFLNFKGRVRVQNISPRVLGVVELGHDQGTKVHKGLPPIAAFVVNAGYKQQFMDQMNTGLNARNRGKDSGTETSGSQGSQLGQGSFGSGQLILVSTPPKVKPQEEQTREEPTNIVKNEVPVEELPPPPQPVVEPPSSTPYHVDWSSCGQYTMEKGTQSGETGPQAAIYTGSLTLANASQVNFTVMASDPNPPGNFNQSSSGTITWTVKGDLAPTGPNSYSGTVTATGTTQGGTVFTFTLDASYENGKLTLTSVGPVSGGYVSTSTTGDFTLPSPQAHKITDGKASISWTLTPTASSTKPLAATAPVTSTLTTAISLPSTNAISAVNALPPSPILSTVTGPPGMSGAGNPGGPQGSPAASAAGLPVVAGGGPPGLTGNVPAVVAGGGSPGLSGTAPGLSPSGPPGLSGGGPPGQLKDKGK